MKKSALILALMVSVFAMAQEKNAFLWEIEPYEHYTEADLDWRNKQSRSSLEMAKHKSVWK